ncbi:MAG: ferritin-like protein [Verrucomicrobiales bacterium]|nr:ferritin-like protein [Verrucomicrobiales bacterium]
MSYLAYPRLHFAGQFQADVSTVNNDPTHFNNATFQPAFHELGHETNGWWNPRGSGAWRFIGCTVRRVVYADGTTCEDPLVDPIVGAPINGAEARVEGKVVDLDSQNQNAAEIWGFRVLVGGGDCGLAGDFKVAAFTDFWPRFASGEPDSFWSAFYQSILDHVSWRNIPRSRFLRELMIQGTAPEQLSIKFVADGIDTDASSPTFTLGRLVGTIGRQLPGEPHHFIPTRALVQSGVPALAPAYAAIENGVLHLDFGNSLPTQCPAGPFVDLGDLYLAAQPSDAPPRLLGRIPYQDPLLPDWYARTAGIVSLPLSAEALQAAESQPLVIASVVQVPQPLAQLPALLGESRDGLFVRADQFVFRFQPGESQTVRFHATRFGRAAARERLTLALDPSLVQQQIIQGTSPGPSALGVPESAVQFTKQITTNAEGTAELTIRASDPGRPRDYIDGQLYCLSYALGDTAPPFGSVPNASQLLNLLVFSGYPIPDRPTWLEHVEPIFRLYANLYPVMRPMVDLSDYASVMGKRAILRRVFAAPITDPNYMPVTRDLSAAKRTTIQRWLEDPKYLAFDSREDLLRALQLAIELEHATIPPYLCALYSIKEGCNVEVAALLRSVVVEEMLHLSLVANLLISLGGHPSLNGPSFIPRYPCSLPGGLRSGLTVRLRRCSLEHIREVFMAIEEPATTLEPEHGAERPGNPRESHRYTIAWFYQQIDEALTLLHQRGEISFGHSDRQVTAWSGPGKLWVVQNLQDAQLALREIKEQGEGRGPLHPGDSIGELAHFYRFSEIVAGRRLVVRGDGFAYDGEVIPFDPEGVWPMVDDPGVVPPPAGSRAAILSASFATTYASLLANLHRAFNGNPELLNQGMGLMYSLSVTARELMRTPSGRDDATTAGPSFLPAGMGS